MKIILSLMMQVHFFGSDIIIRWRLAAGLEDDLELDLGHTGNVDPTSGEHVYRRVIDLLTSRDAGTAETAVSLGYPY